MSLGARLGGTLVGDLSASLAGDASAVAPEPVLVFSLDARDLPLGNLAACMTSQGEAMTQPNAAHYMVVTANQFGSENGMVCAGGRQSFVEGAPLAAAAIDGSSFTELIVAKLINPTQPSPPTALHGALFVSIVGNNGYSHLSLNTLEIFDGYDTIYWNSYAYLYVEDPYFFGGSYAYGPTPDWSIPDPGTLTTAFLMQTSVEDNLASLIVEGVLQQGQGALEGTHDITGFVDTSGYGAIVVGSRLLNGAISDFMSVAIGEVRIYSPALTGAALAVEVDDIKASWGLT